MGKCPTGIRTHRLHTQSHRGAKLAVNAGNNARLKSYTLPTALSGSHVCVLQCQCNYGKIVQLESNASCSCQNNATNDVILDQ